MMLRRISIALLSIAQAAAALAVFAWGIGTFDASGVHAQDRSFETGAAVRRTLLFRSDRFEVSPSLGTETGTVYERGITVGLSGDYHLTNMFSVGLNAFVMPFALRKPVYSNFRDVNPERAERVDTARTLVAADLHLGIVPFSGKFNFLRGRTTHYDVQIQAGFGIVLRDSDASALSGIRPAPTVAVNGRVFLRDDIALRLRVQNYIHESADAQVTRRSGAVVPVDETLRQHYMVTLGVSLFFPEAVRIAR